MKKIYKFISWLFGYGKPIVENTEKLIKEELHELKKMKKSLDEINVIYQEVSTKIKYYDVDKFKNDLVINPRLTTNELKVFLNNYGVLETDKMSRKEKQFYAKKIHTLRHKWGMNIVFNKKNKFYKSKNNG